MRDVSVLSTFFIRSNNSICVLYVLSKKGNVWFQSLLSIAQNLLFYKCYRTNSQLHQNMCQKQLLLDLLLPISATNLWCILPYSLFIIFSLLSTCLAWTNTLSCRIGGLYNICELKFLANFRSVF